MDMYLKRVGFLFCLLGIFVYVQSQNLAFPGAEGYLLPMSLLRKIHLRRHIVKFWSRQAVVWCDDYDNEIISQIKRGVSPYGNNGFIDTPAQAGGWPELRKGTSLLDSDDDGMPDEWEKKHHLNPQDASDASSFTLNRYYTNVEMYMNSLIEGPVD